jgi:hypothetical protein
MSCLNDRVYGSKNKFRAYGWFTWVFFLVQEPQFQVCKIV